MEDKLSERIVELSKQRRLARKKLQTTKTIEISGQIKECKIMLNFLLTDKHYLDM